MSLILEALRKSEAERQLGRAPGLLTPMPMPPPERRLGRTLALGLPLLVAVAIGGWWLGRGGDAGGPGGPVPIAAEPPAALEPPAMRPPDETRPTGAAADTARSEPPAGPRKVAAGTIAARATPPAADPPPVVAPAPDPMPAASRAPAPTVPAVIPPPATASFAEPTDAAPAVPAPATEPAPAAAIAEPALPGLESLDAARRTALPPLRISLHMYNDAPAQRFVLIDGRRYGEGQAIDASVQVSEIRRDGVVLAIDGRHVMLRRP